MNNRDKEIRRLMAEKGFNSFDDLSERLNNFPEPSSAKDIEDKLAKLINPQALFTLTAEDINTIKLMAFLSFEHLDLRVQYNLNAKEECQGDVDKINELLTRIKQWQDENRTNNRLKKMEIQKVESAEEMNFAEAQEKGII